MKYQVLTEIYEPAGVYPIATKPETLYTPEPDTTTGRRAAFSQYGTRVHSGKFSNGRRWWKHEKKQGGYIHITTIKDYATDTEPAEEEHGLTIQEAAERVQAREAARAAREAEEYRDQIAEANKQIVRNRSNHNRSICNDGAPTAPERQAAPRQQDGGAAEPTAAPEQIALF